MTSEEQELRKQTGAEMAPVSIENVLTGGDNRGRHLLDQLKISMAMAESIDIIVSFLMELGAKTILKDLERGVSARILTGSYPGIIQLPPFIRSTRESKMHGWLWLYGSGKEKDLHRTALWKSSPTG